MVNSNEDKMSYPNTAEEIANKYFEIASKQGGSRPDMIWAMVDAMQEHTAQTLDRLKDKAKGLKAFYMWDEAGKQVLTNKEQVVRLKDVLNLIEEVRDE